MKKHLNMRHPNSIFSFFLLALAASACALDAPPSAPVRDVCGLAADCLASFDVKQKAKAQLAWDSPDRAKWHFLPMKFRKGLPLAEMTEAQKGQTWRLLAAVMSQDALAQAKLTLEREARLAKLENNPSRDPGRYFLTVFGDPASGGKWGFSFEGHHLSLNFAFDKEEMVGATPMFFGANPALAEEGKGEVCAYATEDKALLDFVASLSPEMRHEAQLPAKVEQAASAGGNARITLPEKPAGLCAAKMTEPQRAAFLALVRTQIGKGRGQAVDRLLAQIAAEAPEKQFFAFSGEAKGGMPHACLIQTGVVCVFLDAQVGHGPPKANHLHTMWRRVEGDF